MATKSPSTAAAVFVLALLGGGGYVAAKAISAANRKDDAPATPEPVRSPYQTQLPATTPAGWTIGSFPLVIGQKNSLLVKQLQEALLKRGGKAAQEVATTGGADGSFGAGVSRALAAAGLPNTTTVTQSTFDLLVNSAPVPNAFFEGGAPTAAPDPLAPVGLTITPQQADDIGYRIKVAVNAEDAPAALAQLARIRTVEDYHLVNDNGQGLQFGLRDFFYGDVQLAAKLLDTFPTDGRFPAFFTKLGLKRNPGGNFYTPAQLGLKGLGELEEMW